MRKITRRGYDENDKKWFSNKELIKLKKAKEEVEWLINRDYKIDNVVNFVCNRYQFSNRQRDCIKRIVCSDEKKEIRKNNCESAVFYLDAPVSNSGNLKYKIIESFKQKKVDVNVELVNNPDIILEKLDRVISSDAIIIDKCISYFNMTKSIIEEYIQDANIINLNN